MLHDVHAEVVHQKVAEVEEGREEEGERKYEAQGNGDDGVLDYKNIKYKS